MINPQELHPTLQVGKNGITPQLIEELERQLKKRKVVKIKMLRSFLDGCDRTEAALRLSKETGSKIVQVTGFAVVLQKNGPDVPIAGCEKRSPRVSP